MRDERAALAFRAVDCNKHAPAGVNSRFQTSHGSLTTVPLPSGSFDVAICCFATDSVDLAAFFGEVHRLLTLGVVTFSVDTVHLGLDPSVVALFGYTVWPRALDETAAAELDLEVFELVDTSGWAEAQFLRYFSVLYGDVRPER